MERFGKIIITLGFLLIIGVLMTGCSDSQDSSGISETIAAATTTAPLYTAGDIVRSTSGSDSPAWLVVGYDPAGDSYSRALIYKNADGTYGYRVNSRTETSTREMMEKVYTVKITHVAVSSVPTAAPATATTAPAETAAQATTGATAAATTSTARPSIKEMDPDEGEAGTTVVTEITGSDFISNLTALLRHSGEPGITASKVTWYSSSSVTCTFDIPDSAKVGTWDIVITNPNGQSGEFANYFMVHGNETES